MRSSLPWAKSSVVVAALVAGSAAHRSLGASLLNVYGWLGTADALRTDQPDEWLGDDAIVGRQVCPALVRYNHAAEKSEAVLLRTLPEGAEKTALVWSFSLRPGLRWWSGAGVIAQDLADFLKRELDQLTSKHQITAAFKIENKPTSVEVHWASAPNVGPYIFDGRPFWRPAAGKSVSFECAGLYKIAEIIPKQSLRLTLGPDYSARFTEIRMSLEDKRPQTPYVSFQFAEDLLASKVQKGCAAKLDTPIVTAILWNPKSPITSSAKVRQALTSAVPRGEILRTAGAGLGTLLSAPILRIHPGYSSSHVVRPYSLEISDQVLAAQGYVQSSVSSPRKGSDGKVLRLKIATTSEFKQELVEKIITDSFASLGIEVDFARLSASAGVAGFDGILTGISLPWPSLDLKSTFSQGAGERLGFPFFALDDKPLSESLSAYSDSVTRGQPRFEALRKFHARFMELEPWTLVMSHQACVQVSGLSLRGRVSLSDPDWFRRQLID